MWTAFIKGCKSNNLYQKKRRHEVDLDRWENIEAISIDVLEVKDPVVHTAVKAFEFAVYSMFALCMLGFNKGRGQIHSIRLRSWEAILRLALSVVVSQRLN